MNLTRLLLAALLVFSPGMLTLWAAIAIGRLGQAARQAVPALTQALADTSAHVRQAATVALGELGAHAQAARRPVTHLLSDPDEAVRRAAAQALAQIAPGGRAVVPTHEAQLALLDRLVPALMAELHVPGVAIALIQDRQLIASRGYGVRNAQSREPVGADTVFEAASMSKPIFALLAMQLVAGQRLDLHQSINATAQGDIAHHSGANSTGFGCFSQFSPSRGSGIVILTNGTQGSELWARVIAAMGDL